MSQHIPMPEDIFNYYDWFLTPELLLENIQNDFSLGTTVQQMRIRFDKQVGKELAKLNVDRHNASIAGDGAELKYKLFMRTKDYAHLYTSVKILLEKSKTTNQDAYVIECCEAALESFKLLFEKIVSIYGHFLPNPNSDHIPDVITFFEEYSHKSYKISTQELSLANETEATYGNAQNKIHSNANKTTLEGYFNILTTKIYYNEKSASIVEFQDVDYILRANFAIYPSDEHPIIPVNFHGPNNLLIRIVYLFYQNYSYSNNDAALYHKFIKNNFNPFKNVSLATIKSHFSSNIKRHPEVIRLCDNFIRDNRVS